uniref:RNA polymerase II subunit A C-terminal domain phosphatase n=1 Tax=Kwoniella pini CBS 10737 TaxID=1296096 RepID=A0A1B9I066_9TREE|nr:uncharacterized protein I206_04609 [Kwoniella pini CBS 10737]OCF48922.1 hypothetical protein I206_04609 [Kwoniella pini CBS 10737]
MSDPPTPLSLPSTLPYPITITRLLVKPNDTVKRGTNLLEYSFMSKEQKEAISKREKEGRKVNLSKGEIEGDDGSATWDCLIDGEVVNWEGFVKLGTKLERWHMNQPLINIAQPCSHPVQLHGMCGICGADLTDTSNQAGPSRHPGGFEVTHDSMGVTVSKNEAHRLDNLTRDNLLSSRKLSLIVDLDQTIIHTTVDPTVAEWMDEIDTYNRQESFDVARFQIADDLPPGYVKPKRRPGEKMIQMQGRWYFTKPRPGLQKFMDEMSEIYEMHVYTMGTRSYADAICKVIDPDGKIFGGRILSRDESGSFSSKNLKRLFPTDTSMVVVIDDRSDVWADCPNLVKVVPYDFFIGIGDINSSFLPKNKSTPPPSSTATTSISSPAPPSPTSSGSTASTPPPTTPENLPSVEDGLLMKAKLLDDLSESRPLAKMQEEIELNETDVKSQETLTEQEPKSRPDEPERMVVPPAVAQPSTPPRPRKPLLNPNDYELLRISDILQEIHHRFYRAFDSLEEWDTKSPLPMSCDVEFIIPELKSKVLEGCNLVFSGLIPQAVNPETTDIWQTAETFGALCSLSVHPRITHCVTATLNTEKTYKAAQIHDAKIVWANWFWDSVALWNRQDEQKYLAKRESRSRTTTPPLPSSEQSVAENHSQKTTNDSISSAELSGFKEDGEIEERENMEDDAEVGKGWDEGADAEWEAFMAEDDDDEDFRTENGSVKSVDSVPSTPSKKRVRYADEESLPLEDFKDPSPTDQDDQPSKRRKPLLLQAPSEQDQIPNENKFLYKGKGKLLSDDRADGVLLNEAMAKEKDVDELSLAGTEATEGTEEDEFAMMLMDSLANEDEGGNDSP